MFQKYLDPKNDLAFKKIFGMEKHKHIPINFLNAVFHLTGKDKITDLEFINIVQPPEIQARKESIVDVMVKDKKGSKYIIEMQVTEVGGFEKRAQYYAAKTYCSNFNKGFHYWNLKKVIFLAITSYIQFPKKKNYKSNHGILDKETYENDLKDFSFTFVELPKFTKTVPENMTLEEKWYYFLKTADESRDVNKALAEVPEIKEAYEIIESVNWTEEELLTYEQIGMAIADHTSGLMAATEKGIKKGRQEALRAIAAQLLEENFPFEKIASLTKLSIHELKDLKIKR